MRSSSNNHRLNDLHPNILSSPVLIIRPRQRDATGRIMRLLEFFLHSQLTRMGWPRAKGFFRRRYVDAFIADTTIEQGLQVIVGLGAARPEIAVAMLADTFSGNPWTEESTEGLFRNLRIAQDIVTNYPDMTPWRALWQEHRLAPYSEEWRWPDLFDDNVGLIRAQVGSRAVYWGLTNHHEMQMLFDRDKSAYQTSVIEANQHGLGVSDSYPFESLDHFYESCDDIFHTFIEVLPTLSGSMAVPWPTASDIPPRLRTMPEVARRLD